MKQLFLLCFLLIPSFESFSQSPGYLGKKTSVQFNFSSSLALMGPTQNNHGFDAFAPNNSNPKNSPVGLNTKYGASINRVIGRRVSIEAGADLGKTGYNGEFQTHSVFNGVDVNDYDFHSILFNANTTDLYLSLRFYNRKKGSIAPLGLYLAPKIGYSMTKSVIVDRFTRPHYLSTGEQINAFGFSEKHAFYTVGFGTGFNRIIKDQIVLNLGWEFTYFIKAGKDVLFSTQNSNSNTAYQSRNNASQHQEIIDRLNMENMFMFRIGLGYLF